MDPSLCSFGLIAHYQNLSTTSFFQFSEVQPTLGHPARVKSSLECTLRKLNQLVDWNDKQGANPGLKILQITQDLGHCEILLPHKAFHLW